jgi:hypothetical protein
MHLFMSPRIGVRHLGVRWLVLAGVACTLSSALEAQRAARPFRFGMGLGISVVGSSNRYVGAGGAAHVQFNLTRAVGRSAELSLLVDTYLSETMESIPGCVPGGGYCDATTERPGVLLGVSAESRVYPWRTGLGIAGGVGVITGPGVKGADPSATSAMVSVGADYELGGPTSWLPMIGARYTRLAGNVAGVRWIASPAMSWKF